MRAPEQVRATVEQWLAKESCTVALSVRIVPTEGGLYLLATDEHGRVRERIVPDASSAGVLIASWAADDGLGGAAPPRIAPVQPYAPPPAAPYAPPPTAQFPYQAGAAPVTAFGPGDFHPNASNDVHVQDDDDDDDVPPKPTFPQKFVTVSGGVGTNSSGGIRLELDLANFNGWTLGIVGSVMKSQQFATADTYSQGYDQSTLFTADLVDYIAALDVGHIWHLGGWHVRGSLGAGLVYSTLNLAETNYDSGYQSGGSGSMASPYIEAGAMLGHSFGEHDQWAVELGPQFTYTQQQWYVTDNMATMTRDAGNLLFVVGLRHGL